LLIPSGDPRRADTLLHGREREIRYGWEGAPASHDLCRDQISSLRAVWLGRSSPARKAGQLWNNAAGTMNAFSAGYTAAFAGVLAAPAIGGAISVTANRVLFGSALNRVFWSGGTSAAYRAWQWASSNEGTTLDMTPAGRALTALGDWVPSSVWSTASRLFAQGASGPVVAFQGTLLRLAPVLNTWAAEEYPQLLLKRNPISYIGVAF
jgi:hypothetical protein